SGSASNGCAKARSAFASTPCTSPFSIRYSSIWLARTRGSARDTVLPPQLAAHASLGGESRGSAQACAMAGSPVCQDGRRGVHGYLVGRGVGQPDGADQIRRAAAAE